MSPREFVARPVGSYVAGRTWLCFCADPSLVVSVLWGRVDEQALQAWFEIAPETSCPDMPAHAHLVDAQHVQAFDAWHFALLRSHVEEHHAALERAVTRLAIVRPEGFLGSVAEGFFRVVRAPYPARVFRQRDAALRWLRAAEVARDLADAVAAARGASQLLVELREVLAQPGAGASIGKVARQMGVSPRTLQRRLHLEKTSFRSEVNAARIRAAQELLLSGNASIAEIAFEVGYASPAHLSEQFRRRTGETPSRWREKRISGA